ncbi:MAG: glycogen-branching enzyme, partial [Erysipelotrichaceae bacterium]|nr:glycogen-branching enzyme [Erysipelotrichaceae bacterium]
MKLKDFYNGKELKAYQYLGAHVEKKGVTFRTYAPKAGNVSLIGEFNDWTDTPMKRVQDGQFFEVTVPDAKPGQMYKYRIYHRDGRFIDHCDPYGFHAEMRPANASIIFDMNHYHFHDKEWLKQRTCDLTKPINIYELHFGSWRKKEDTTDPSGWYRYEELGDLLIPYLNEYGYNYVEIMPLNEYPSDESWGYQATGFFSPTSRYGNPDGLRAFVDQCHQHGIGVIMDFVPVHFAVNDYALWNYDGTPLYENAAFGDGRSEWGSNNFNHSRGDVCSFLSSAAYYWLKEYHIDGLRMDAVGNLIYRQGDQNRGENTHSIRFVQEMNKALKKSMPDIMLFAEDSSSWLGVTKPVEKKGLGFDYKWDLGWMNDTLSYFQTDFKARSRSEVYHKLTFSMMYYYNEQFVLPFSHDEVVHGKKTIIDKMA